MADKTPNSYAYHSGTEELKSTGSPVDHTTVASAPPLEAQPPNYFDISLVPPGEVLFKHDVPPFAEPSQAEIERSSKGVVSFDPLIDRNPDQLWLYFMTYLNEKPHQHLSIRGHHTESYTTTETYTNPEGYTQTRLVTDTREATDFYFSIDLTPYICDHWWRIAVARSKEATKENEFVSFRDALEQYTRSDKGIKEIKLTKQVHGWDYQRLQHQVIALVRSTGYPHDVDVSFSVSNTDIMARSSSGLSRFANSTVARVLCVLSCLWIIFAPIYCCLRSAGRTRDRIVADYSILATPDIFLQRNGAQIINAVNSGSRGNFSAYFN